MPTPKQPSEPARRESGSDRPTHHAQTPRRNEQPSFAEQPQDMPRPKPVAGTRALIVALKIVVGIIVSLAVLAGGLIGYLTLTEYDPGYAENAMFGANRVSTDYVGQRLRIVSFNTGYGGLGRDADSVLDGGKQVNPDSEQTVLRNMKGIEEILNGTGADILMLQEVDTDSARSFGHNQFLQYEHDLTGYEARFALNYSCDYVPYPLNDRIGKVNSGLATYSRYGIVSATRYSLYCPFTWPTRVANLKRCLLVTRIAIKNSEKELVLINLHLDAYDDGTGRAKQAEQLLGLMQTEYAKGNYVIAGGDFNQIFPGGTTNFPLKESSEWRPAGLKLNLPSGWSYACDLNTPSCRLLNQPYDASSAKTQYYVIDGFILSPNIELTQVQTLNARFVYSDHNPVVLDIQLKLEQSE